MPETDRKEAIAAICEEFKAVLVDADLAAKLDQQTPKSGVKLAVFNILGIGQGYERYEVYLDFDEKQTAPRFGLVITQFNPVFGGTGEGGSFSYWRKRTHSGRGSWNKTNQFSTPVKFSDQQIANILLDHNVQPGDIKRTIQQTLGLP